MQNEIHCCKAAALLVRNISCNCLEIVSSFILILPRISFVFFLVGQNLDFVVACIELFEHFGLQNQFRLVVVLVFVAGSSELFMLSCRIGGRREGSSSKLQTKLHSANAAAAAHREK